MKHYKAIVIKHPSCHKIEWNCKFENVTKFVLHTVHKLNPWKCFIFIYNYELPALHNTVSYVTYFETTLHQNVPTYFYVLCLKFLRNRATTKQYLEQFANAYYFLAFKEVIFFKTVWIYVQKSPLCVHGVKHMTAKYAVGKTIRALHVSWLLVAEVRVRRVTTHIILRGEYSIISAESCRWIFQCTSKEFYEMLMLPVTCLKITGLSKAAILKKCNVDTA
jgi:hypothetical protein